MNVDISFDNLIAERAWFDGSCNRLFIQAGDYVNGIEFGKISDDDFESASPVVGFSVGQSGSVVICRHKDGEETWLPVDMWAPSAF